MSPQRLIFTGNYAVRGFITSSAKLNEGVTKRFRTGHLEREPQML